MNDMMESFDDFLDRWIRRLAIVAAIVAIIWIIIPGVCMIIRGQP